MLSNPNREIEYRLAKWIVANLEANAKQFIRVVRRFTEMQELTPEIVATLIERVEVGQAQVVDGEKKQEIKIVYNFIGDIRE